MKPVPINRFKNGTSSINRFKNGTGSNKPVRKRNRFNKPVPKKNRSTSPRKYEGEFKENLRHGNGTYYCANGDKYVGEFKDDKKRLTLGNNLSDSFVIRIYKNFLI
jgi:hypothetical protein